MNKNSIVSDVFMFIVSFIICNAYNSGRKSRIGHEKCNILPKSDQKLFKMGSLLRAKQKKWSIWVGSELEKGVNVVSIPVTNF